MVKCDSICATTRWVKYRQQIAPEERNEDVLAVTDGRVLLQRVTEGGDLLGQSIHHLTLVLIGCGVVERVQRATVVQRKDLEKKKNGKENE